MVFRQFVANDFELYGEQFLDVLYLLSWTNEESPSENCYDININLDTKIKGKVWD